VVNQVIFSTFEIAVLSSERIVDARQMPLGLQTHQTVSFIIKFENTPESPYCSKDNPL